MIMTYDRKQRSVRVCKRKLEMPPPSREDYERTPEEEEDGHPLGNSDSLSGDDSVVHERIKKDNEDNINDGSLKGKETKRKRLIEGNEQLNVGLDGMEDLLSLANVTVEEGEKEKEKEIEIESCTPSNDSMSLSNPYNAGSSSQSYHFLSLQEERSHLATSSERITTVVHMKATSDQGLFKCKGCNKTFTSHQALGGHRASHKNVRGCFAAKAENSEESSQDDVEEDDEVNPNSERRVEKLHECTICDRKFPTGQALGGHKRCHWISRTLSTKLTSVEENIQHHHQQQQQQLTTKEIALKKLKEFDLNFPAISELVPTSPPVPNYNHQLLGQRINLNINNNNNDINVDSHNVIEGGSRVGDSEFEERRQSETSNNSVEDDDTMTLLSLGCARNK